MIQHMVTYTYELVQLERRNTLEPPIAYTTLLYNLNKHSTT